MSETLKLTVPGSPGYVATVRLAVSSVANMVGFDISAIEDIRVAVSEACNNIIVHAEITNDTYDVTVTTDEGRIDIFVSDQGIGYDTNADIASMDHGEFGLGLGVTIIKALMDEVDITSAPGKGTTIHMTKYVQAG